MLHDNSRPLNRYNPYAGKIYSSPKVKSKFVPAVMFFMTPISVGTKNEDHAVRIRSPVRTHLSQHWISVSSHERALYKITARIYAARPADEVFQS